MNAYKCHYCKEGKQREILLVNFTRFCRFSKAPICKISPMSKNGRLKPGKFVSQIRQNKTVLNITVSMIFSNARHF